MSSLPPEIITNFLIRLPVKSLLRFRCVSKPWCAEIDCPDFIKLHVTQSITTGSNLSPIAQSEGTLYSLDSDSLENLVKIETPSINPHQTIWPSICNGLLLLQVNDWDPRKSGVSLIISNPFTRKHLVLPNSPPINNYVDVGFVVSANCLGYDVINNDYKVFKFLIIVDKDYRSIGCESRVYSSKFNEWHIVKDFAKGLAFDRFFEAYVNGALHTLNAKDHRTIIAFDVGKETFDLLPMPNYGDKSSSHFRFHVFDGCLAVLHRYPDDRTDIWVMKEYGVKESWSMLFSVKPKNPYIYLIPLVYSKSRREVLLSYDCEKLVWYDLSKKTFRGLQVTGLPIQFFPIVCVESLVSVGGTGKVGEE